jgi:hypothetical protein
VDADAGVDTRFALATFEGVNNSDYFGQSVAAPGDIDGDGAADLVIGKSNDSTYGYMGGAVCLWYGPVTGTHTCDAADAAWFGPNSNAQLGWSLAAGADLTGDGYADLVAGAPEGVGGGVTNAGTAYLIPGLAP